MAVEAPDLPYARDLKADGEAAAKARVPVVILFSLPGCPYCNEIRRAHLLPMLADPARAKLAIVRQVDLSGPTPMLGWDGKQTTHGRFARDSNVRFAPVVVFCLPSGKPAGDPLVGGMLPDFYAHYLETALAAATKAVAEEK